MTQLCPQVQARCILTAMAEEQRNCKGTQYLLRLRTGNTITLLAKASHNTSLTREIASLVKELQNHTTKDLIQGVTSWDH